MTKKKKDSGRPGLTNKRKQLQLNVLEEERELLGRAADYYGLPLAAWIRQKALEAAREIEPQLPPERSK